MNTAIIYYSMSGNCEMVAGKMAALLGADVIRIEPEKAYPDKGARKFIWGGKSAVMGETPKLKPYSFDASGYDRIIFGFPVWASNVTPPIRTFIKENLTDIKDKKFAAFACQSGNGAAKAFDKLKKLLETDDLDAELVLIDPKVKENPENDRNIEEYCIRLGSIKDA